MLGVLPQALAVLLLALSLGGRWGSAVLEILGLMSLTSICTRPSASHMEEVALAWGPLECEFWAAGSHMALEIE